jgi:hypothetical protein
LTQLTLHQPDTFEKAQPEPIEILVFNLVMLKILHAELCVLSTSLANKLAHHASLSDLELTLPSIDNAQSRALVTILSESKSISAFAFYHHDETDSTDQDPLFIQRTVFAWREAPAQLGFALRAAQFRDAQLRCADRAFGWRLVLHSTFLLDSLIIDSFI